VKSVRIYDPTIPEDNFPLSCTRRTIFSEVSLELPGTAVHMIRKGRVRWVVQGNVIAQAQFISKLFGLAA
jgi:hypothetical protein